MSLRASQRSDQADVALRFATTQWSVVVAAGQSGSPDSAEALASLCETYWYPIYAYVRRNGESSEDAKDLTQSFFTHLLEKDVIPKADPDRGQFRAFLITSLKHFLSNERHKAGAKKRGGGNLVLSLDFEAGESRYQIEPSHDLTPEKLYERRWVLVILDQVLDRLGAELKDAGQTMHFERLKPALVSEMTIAEYEQASQALGITASAAKQAAYRMRKRYRELLRLEVMRTVAADSEINEEIGRLLRILRE